MLQNLPDLDLPEEVKFNFCVSSKFVLSRRHPQLPVSRGLRARPVDADPELLKKVMFGRPPVVDDED